MYYICMFKVELEAGAQARVQEMGALRQEVTRLRERLQGDMPPQGPEVPPPQLPSPAQVITTPAQVAQTQPGTATQETLTCTCNYTVYTGRHAPSRPRCYIISLAASGRVTCSVLVFSFLSTSMRVSLQPEFIYSSLTHSL